MKDVAGKVAFITGGGSGIGLGIARAFVDAGMRVVVTYLTEAERDEATKYLGMRDGFHAMQVDVTNRSQMEEAAAQTVKRLGRVHVVVNNAGILSVHKVNSTSYEEWDRVIAVNLTGVFNGIHAFLSQIQAQGEGGHIVATASIGGLLVACPGYAVYCASKFAVVGLMEALRAELADSNIGASVLCPGPVRSNLMGYLNTDPSASDPLDIGRQVLRGIQNDDLYILTHSEYDEFLQFRHDLLMASLPKDLPLSPEKVELTRRVLLNSIYAKERDRALSGQ